MDQFSSFTLTTGLVHTNFVAHPLQFSLYRSLHSRTPPFLQGDRVRNTLRRSRRRLLALVGSAALALAGAIALPGTAQAANILTNPGFESGGLSPWTCTGNLGSVVSSPVHGGSKALQGAVSASDNAQCSQTVSVQPNTTYSLSGWVRGSYVYLGVDGGASTWTSSPSAYSRLSVSFTTGASQTSATIYVHG